jgi:hypothetical protein
MQTVIYIPCVQVTEHALKKQGGCSPVLDPYELTAGHA